MLPVGGQPLLEIIVRQLHNAGIDRVHMNLHHQSENIIEHFGDGRDFGVHMTYLTEDRPLGTAGALGLMDQPQNTMLVINGDILTQVDFEAMMAFHQEHNAELTVAVQQYQLNVPYGVVDCDGAAVRGFSEKPDLSYFINAGIYLLEPSVHELIPSGDRYDMTELIQQLIDDGRPVAAFPIHEKWLDIGRHADYEQAQEMVKDWPARQ
jgi:NDP-sugar pyrophosphorylase family protein